MVVAPMKTIQIHTCDAWWAGTTNNDLLRYVGIKRIHPGWYTVTYHGTNLDKSTIRSAKRNPKGLIRE
jgi:hypothetical protein